MAKTLAEKKADLQAKLKKLEITEQIAKLRSDQKKLSGKK